jgi:hypothetical protein
LILKVQEAVPAWEIVSVAVPESDARVALRGDPLFAAADHVTAPLPVQLATLEASAHPPLAAVSVNHDGLGVCTELQLVSAVILTVPVPPEAGTFPDEGV